MRTVFLFPMIWALAMPASAQPRSSRLPRFEDYPVKEVYTGVLAPPKILTPLQRKYRTRIRHGVEKGWGVFRGEQEQGHPGPNFAGNMIVVQWGCGVPCLMMALVDARTGDIHYLPITYDGVGVQTFDVPYLALGLMPQVAEVEFRLDSRLMIVRATMKQSSHAYYFLWQDARWRLLRKIPLEKESLIPDREGVGGGGGD